MSAPKTYLQAYVRGAITPIEQATISIMSFGLCHGASVATDLEAYQMGNSIGIFRLDDHLMQLKRRCEEARLPYEVDVTAIKHAITTLVSRNRPAGVICIRLLIYRADTHLNPGASETYDLAMYLHALPPGIVAGNGLDMYLHPELFTLIPIRQYSPADIAEKGF
jgi:branched-subunit amino acid aminotransferase/4-amino-4-deoxychorismate lyase